MNGHLSGFGEEALASDTASEPVPCFDIGTPRSGTTLLTQLFAHSLSVGYTDNLAAAFGKAPVVGIRLSRKLLGGTPVDSFESAYGRTRGIAEPHEFGYFWRDILGESAVDEGVPVAGESWDRLKRAMTLFAGEFWAPFVLKAFWAGWYLQTLQALLPSSLFFFLERDLTETAVSILLARRAYAGSETAWIGPLPSGLEHLELNSPAEEVAAQLLLLTRTHRERCEQGDGSRILWVPYRELCAYPSGVLERAQAMIEGVGAEASLRNPPPALTPKDPFLTEGLNGNPVRDPGPLREEVQRAFRTLERQLDGVGGA